MVRIRTSQTGMNIVDRGFTVLEMLVVLCLMGLVSAALALSFRSVSERGKLTKAAVQIAADLTRVADTARRSGRNQTVFFGAQQSSTNSGAQSAPISIPVGIEVRWTGAGEVGSTQKTGVMVFFGVGGSSGGNLWLSDKSRQVKISIDWLTADVRMEEAP